MHQHIQQAAELARHAARLADPDTFGLSTTCSEFDVKALSEHMLNFARLTAHTAKKTQPEGDRLEVEAGWQAEYDRWVDQAIEAWSEPDALDGTTGFGGDPMSAESAAGLTVMEFAVHAWDLARTFEETIDVPAETARVVLGVVERLAEPGRQAGVFGPPVPVTESMSAFEQALAMSGRNPNR